ncbi:MAG: TolC family protein [Cyclobacteriaceae bacterium]
MKIGNLVFIFLMFVGTTVDAQNRPLTFYEAVKIALKNNIQLNQQRNNLANSQVQKTAAWAGLAPTLSANASALQVNGNFFNQNEGKVVNGLFDQFSGSLNAQVNLFNGFNRISQIKQNGTQLEAQLHFVHRTEQDAINTVTTQFLQVLLDVELLRIANENWEALKKQLEQVTEQVNVGARSPVDQYNQDSQTKAAEIRALQAEINLINNKALLSQTLLLDPSDGFDVVKPDWEINSISSDEMELKAAYETALKNRGDYLRAEKNELSSKFALNAARGNYSPSLTGFWSMNSAYNKLASDLTAAPFDTQFYTDNLRRTYGVQLFIPILGGNTIFQNRANVYQQKTTYLNNKILRQNAEILVKTDVLRAYQNFKLVKRTFAVTLSQLEAAEMAFRLETERYNLGVTNFVDYQNANRVFVQAQADKAQAEVRLLFQKVVVAYAAGTLKPEDLQ